MTNKLIEYQRAQRQQVVDRIDAARTMIEQELEQHGYYPLNGGRLTAKELYNRAGIGASTLKNKTHSSTRESTNLWLSGIKARTTESRPQSLSVSETTQLQRSLVGLARKFDLFKLHYEAMEARCSVLESQNEALRTANAVLRGDIAKMARL